jgi:PPOX class probable F420-dependent enzyme
MATIPAEFRSLLTEKKAFAQVATTGKDGPQVTPVWVDFDGTHVLVNTARGRAKVRRVERDPRVAINILDPDNPYRYLEIRGRVVETTEKGAAEHIDKMAKKYLGKDKYPFAQPGEVRVLYKIAPEFVHGRG